MQKRAARTTANTTPGTGATSTTGATITNTARTFAARANTGATSAYTSRTFAGTFTSSCLLLECMDETRWK